MDQAPVDEHLALPKVDGLTWQPYHPFERVVPLSVIQHDHLSSLELARSRLGDGTVVWVEIGQHALSLHHHDGAGHSPGGPEA